MSTIAALIPRYPDETDEGYATRREQMLALLHDAARRGLVSIIDRPPSRIVAIPRRSDIAIRVEV